MTEKVSVMLVDDHEIVRQGLRALLDAEEDNTKEAWSQGESS